MSQKCHNRCKQNLAVNRVSWSTCVRSFFLSRIEFSVDFSSSIHITFESCYSSTLANTHPSLVITQKPLFIWFSGMEASNSNFRFFLTKISPNSENFWPPTSFICVFLWKMDTHNRHKKNVQNPEKIIWKK